MAASPNPPACWPGKLQPHRAGFFPTTKRSPQSARRAIAEAIAKLLADPECRIRMGQAARCRIVENYSTDKVVDRYESLFQEACSQ
jgi:glycosyltransferase involved in cell wall biosynthesis